MNFREYLKESSLSRIWQFIEADKYSFGVMSAFRMENTSPENLQLHKELKIQIREMGYGYIELKGGFTEDGVFTSETSLFIPKINKKQMLELGKQYNQFSVIHKDRTGFYEYAPTGKALSKFKHGSGKDNLDFAKELLKSYFSSLKKGSHKGKKFLFKMEEKETASLNRLAYHRDPLQWFVILEEQ